MVDITLLTNNFEFINKKLQNLNIDNELLLNLKNEIINHRHYLKSLNNIKSQEKLFSSLKKESFIKNISKLENDKLILNEKINQSKININDIVISIPNLPNNLIPFQQISKQVIIIRKDLNMSPGKVAAQVSHASIEAFIKSSEVENVNNDIILKINENSPLNHWINNSYTKVILYVKSEEKLLNIFQKAQDKGLPSVLIQDEGRTEFNNIDTLTAVGIGPCLIDDFNGITDRLRLY